MGATTSQRSEEIPLPTESRPHRGRLLNGRKFSWARQSGHDRRLRQCPAERIRKARSGPSMSSTGGPGSSPDRVRWSAPCPTRIRPLRRDSSYVTCLCTRPSRRAATRGFPGFAGGRKSGLASCLPDQFRLAASPIPHPWFAQAVFHVKPHAKAWLTGVEAGLAGVWRQSEPCLAAAGTGLRARRCDHLIQDRAS